MRADPILTAPQQWALAKIRAGKGVSPATLGYAMAGRPGYAEARPKNAQAAGRLGGTMMARLERKGLLRLNCITRGQFHPTTATLTDLGRKQLLRATT